MNAICLVIDRLHLGYLGCYGNAWIDTPCLNRLAADAFVFDQAHIDSPVLEVQYASLTSGTQALARRAGANSPRNVLAQLAAAGVHTALITDDPAVAAFPAFGSLDEVVQLDPHISSAPAEEIAHSNVARFFAVVADWLQTAPEPFCLWLHCATLGTVWDAPLALRAKYGDEDEPPPYAETAPPQRKLAPDYDPDELLTIAHAYAGEISQLDLCLGAMIDDLDRLPLSERTLLSISSARGYPLGEHLRIGAVDDALYAETVHAAWLLRVPMLDGAAARSRALVGPYDLAPTLAEWFSLPEDKEPRSGHSLLPIVRGDIESVRDRAFVSGANGARAVRTPAWYLYAPSTADDRSASAASTSPASATHSAVELYALPDDRWELNDVADRCPQVVELLEPLLTAGPSPHEEGAEEPLAEILQAGLD